jgi:hypothetical protein
VQQPEHGTAPNPQRQAGLLSLALDGAWGEVDKGPDGWPVALPAAYCDHVPPAAGATETEVRVSVPSLRLGTTRRLDQPKRWRFESRTARSRRKAGGSWRSASRGLRRGSGGRTPEKCTTGGA